MRAALIVAVIVLLAHTTARADPSEVDSALKWLDSLDLPPPAGLPFVRVVAVRDRRLPSLLLSPPPDFEPPITTRSWKSSTYYFGLLLAEDKESFTVFCPDFRQRRFAKWRSGERISGPCGLYEKADLNDELKFRLQRQYDQFHKPGATDVRPFARLGSRPEFIWLYWICERKRLGTPEANDLRVFLPNVLPLNRLPEQDTLTDSLASEIGQYLMDQWYRDLDDATIPYSLLLDQLEWYVKHIKVNSKVDALVLSLDEARYYAAILKRMANDERKRAIAPKAQPGSLPDLIYELRNVDAVGMAADGRLFVRDITGKGRSGSATQLLKEGERAVPYLLDALSEKSLTRCVNFSYFMGRMNGVFRVRDCAWLLLKEILRPNERDVDFPKYSFTQTDLAEELSEAEVQVNQESYRDWWNTRRHKP